MAVREDRVDQVGHGDLPLRRSSGSSPARARDDLGHRAAVAAEEPEDARRAPLAARGQRPRRSTAMRCASSGSLGGRTGRWPRGPAASRSSQSASAWRAASTRPRPSRPRSVPRPPRATRRSRLCGDRVAGRARALSDAARLAGGAVDRVDLWQPVPGGRLDLVGRARPSRGPTGTRAWASSLARGRRAIGRCGRGLGRRLVLVVARAAPPGGPRPPRPPGPAPGSRARSARRPSRRASSHGAGRSRSAAASRGAVAAAVAASARRGPDAAPPSPRRSSSAMDGGRHRAVGVAGRSSVESDPPPIGGRIRAIAPAAPRGALARPRPRARGAPSASGRRRRRRVGLAGRQRGPHRRAGVDAEPAARRPMHPPASPTPSVGRRARPGPNGRSTVRHRTRGKAAPSSAGRPGRRGPARRPRPSAERVVGEGRGSAAGDRIGRHRHAHLARSGWPGPEDRDEGGAAGDARTRPIARNAIARGHAARNSLRSRSSPSARRHPRSASVAASPPSVNLRRPAPARPLLQRRTRRMVDSSASATRRSSVCARARHTQGKARPAWPSTPPRNSSSSPSTPPGCSATSSARKRARSARTAAAT